MLAVTATPLRHPRRMPSLAARETLLRHRPMLNYGATECPKSPGVSEDDSLPPSDIASHLQ